MYSYTYGKCGEIGVEKESKVIATTLRDNSDHILFPQMNCMQTYALAPNSLYQFPSICHLIHSYLTGRLDTIYSTKPTKDHVCRKSISSYSSTLETKSASASFFALFLFHSSRIFSLSIFSFPFPGLVLIFSSEIR